MSHQSSDSCGCCGCLSIVILIILGWALVFGVTWGGRYYGLKRCTAEEGVVVDAP